MKRLWFSVASLSEMLTLGRVDGDPLGGVAEPVVNIGSDNDLVPSDNKPLPEPTLP